MEIGALGAHLPPCSGLELIDLRGRDVLHERATLGSVWVDRDVPLLAQPSQPISGGSNVALEVVADVLVGDPPVPLQVAKELGIIDVDGARAVLESRAQRRGGLAAEAIRRPSSSGSRTCRLDQACGMHSSKHFVGEIGISLNLRCDRHRRHRGTGPKNRQRQQNIEVGCQSRLRELLASEKASEGSITLTAGDHDGEPWTNLNSWRLLASCSKRAIDPVEAHSGALCYSQPRDFARQNAVPLRAFAE